MKDLAERINADRGFTSEAYNYIKNELDNETKKPLRKRDFERIEQLTAQLGELTEDNDNSAEPDMDRLYKRIRDYEKESKKPLGVIKRFAPVLCCMALVLAANCVSVFAFDMNIVSAVVELTEGGFFVDFGNKPEEIILPVSDDDPYGFIAKLAEYDIEFETPHYIPEGFVLTEVETNVNEGYANSVVFHYTNGKQSFVLSYDRYFKEIPKIGIPSDHYNISEREVNGSTAVVSKEDNQYTITYEKDKTVFLMFSVDVPYDECEKIVDSIK